MCGMVEWNHQRNLRKKTKLVYGKKIWTYKRIQKIKKTCKKKHFLALKFELQSKEAKQQAILKETEETKEKYERIIKQLEEESAYKMKIFHENS